MSERHRDDWLPDHTSPGPEAKALLMRAGQFARMLGTGWIGVEMIWLAAHEGDVDALVALRDGLRRIQAENRGPFGHFLRASPRTVALLRALPESFSVDQLLGAIRRRAQPVLTHAIGWAESAIAEQFTMATLDVAAARSVPNALEVLGGPDDGTLVRLGLGEAIGGVGAGYVPQPLPRGGLPIEVIKWIGKGRIAAVADVDLYAAVPGAVAEPVLGEIDISVGDVLEIHGGMRFRAIVHIADLSAVARAATTEAINVPPEELARRYTLVRPLGRGGMGVVYDAVDQLTGDRQAIKLIRSWSPQQVSTARREQVALRWLRLPGVVNVYDDGVEAGWWFVAMDFVDGVHFPVRQGPSPWDPLGTYTYALLEVLGRVHAAGVLHLDLKPENAFLTPDRRVILLDFGLAAGTAIDPSRVMGSGTPAYMAPEQVAGLPCDERADLYAIGVMLYEGLAGRIPHHAGSRAEMLGNRAAAPVASLRDKRKDLPDRVIQTIDALLSPDPADRPASCADVARGLFGSLDALDDRPLPLESGWVPRTAEPLFHGPEPFFHLPSDGAAALHRRSSGDPKEAVAELGAWIRGGLATWDEGRVRTDRESLARLDLLAPLRLGSGVSPEREVVACMRSSRLDEVVRTLPARVRDDVDVSRLERAMALAHLGLVMAREVGDEWLELKLLLLHVEAAAAIATHRALDLLLYELGRTQVPDTVVDPLRAVGRAVVTSRNGEFARTAELLVGVSEFEEADWDPIEILRRDVLVRIEALPFDGHERWATTDARKRQTRLWLGRKAYRLGRWDEGVEILELAVQEALTPAQRIASGLFSAMCAMEGGRIDHAGGRALVLAAEAYERRLTYLEAEAWLLHRNVLYRQGISMPCRVDLWEASRHVSWNVEGRFAVLEACNAWRAGDPLSARAIARAAVVRTRATQRGGGAELVRALQVAMGLQGLEDVAVLLAAAESARYPEWAVQIVGLLNIAHGGSNGDLVALARRLADRVTGIGPTDRMDILSIQEAIEGRLAVSAE